MRENYQSWEVKENDFKKLKTLDDKVRFFLRYAILSPSGHNTQPWRFAVHDGSVLVYIDRARALEGSDPERRQLMLAFGCAIENLSVAARHYGFEAFVDYFPDEKNNDLVVAVSFKEATLAHGNEHLFHAITMRATNRGKYAEEGIPNEFKDAASRYAGGDFQVFFIEDAKMRERVADLAVDAQVKIMDGAPFRAELSGYIRNSFTKHKTGMPGFALEIPAPISLIASALIKHINLSRKSMKQDEMLLKKHTPAFMVICSKRIDPSSLLESGRIFERAWLEATSMHLACSPLAAVIQSKPHSAALKDLLLTKFEPQVFFRIGRPMKNARHSPRFALDDILLNETP